MNKKLLFLFALIGLAVIAVLVVALILPNYQKQKPCLEQLAANYCISQNYTFYSLGGSDFTCRLVFHENVTYQTYKTSKLNRSLCG